MIDILRAYAHIIICARRAAARFSRYARSDAAHLCWMPSLPALPAVEGVSSSGQ